MKTIRNWSERTYGPPGPPNAQLPGAAKENGGGPTLDDDELRRYVAPSETVKGLLGEVNDIQRAVNSGENMLKLRALLDATAETVGKIPADYLISENIRGGPELFQNLLAWRNTIPVADKTVLANIVVPDVQLALKAQLKVLYEKQDTLAEVVSAEALMASEMGFKQMPRLSYTTYQAMAKVYECKKAIIRGTPESAILPLLQYAQQAHNYLKGIAEYTALRPPDGSSRNRDFSFLYDASDRFALPRIYALSKAKGATKAPDTEIPDTRQNWDRSYAGPYILDDRSPNPAAKVEARTPPKYQGSLAGQVQAGFQMPRPSATSIEPVILAPQIELGQTRSAPPKEQAPEVEPPRTPIAPAGPSLYERIGEGFVSPQTPAEKQKEFMAMLNDEFHRYERSTIFQAPKAPQPVSNSPSQQAPVALDPVYVPAFEQLVHYMTVSKNSIMTGMLNKQSLAYMQSLANALGTSLGGINKILQEQAGLLQGDQQKKVKDVMCQHVLPLKMNTNGQVEYIDGTAVSKECIFSALSFGAIDMASHAILVASTGLLPNPLNLISTVGSMFGIPGVYDVGVAASANGLLSVLAENHCGCPPLCMYASPSLICNLAIVQLHILCSFLNIASESMGSVVDAKKICGQLHTNVDYNDRMIAQILSTMSIAAGAKATYDTAKETLSGLNDLVLSLFGLEIKGSGAPELAGTAQHSASAVLGKMLQIPAFNNEWTKSALFGSKGISTGRAAFDSVLESFKNDPVHTYVEMADLEAVIALKGAASFLPSFLRM
jgi:hypothetical protein